MLGHITSGTIYANRSKMNVRNLRFYEEHPKRSPVCADVFEVKSFDAKIQIISYPRKRDVTICRI